MGDFFDNTFEEQVKCIIQSGDLKLLQTFIGIRNPIGLLQYYTSFITTKISMLDIKLHGEYKLKEKCLTDYIKNMERLEQQGVTQEKANSSLSYTAVSAVSEAIKEELLTKLLLRETNAQKKTVASICNTDYMFESISDQDLVSYTRNTEINSLCVMDTKQAGEMYDALVQKSHDSLINITENHPYGSPEQKSAINDEIRLITCNILKQVHEIAKYRNVLKQIKDRTFLKDWDRQLESAVITDARTKADHALHTSFPNDVWHQHIFTVKLKGLFIVQVVSRLLKEIVSDRCSKKQLNRLLNILTNPLYDHTKFHYLSFVERTKHRLMQEMNKPELKEILQLIISEIKPENVMKAEQSVLDDILFEAVSLGKQDCALLLICNGADINLQRENKDKTKVNVKGILGEQILNESGLLVIKKLYDEMPSMKASLFPDNDVRLLSEFVMEGASQLDELCEEFTVNDILSLKEISDIFPHNTTIKKASDSMVECNKRRMERKIVLIGERFKAEKAASEKAAWTIDFGKLWSARRNARNELEIAAKDVKTATEMFEVLLESLQMSVVAGSEVFLANCEKVRKEIDFIKRSKEKWINFANVLKAFENAQKATGCRIGSCFETKSVKFGELAEDIIRNRMSYMNELRQSGPPYRSTDQTVIIKNMDNVGAETKRKNAERKGESAMEEKSAIEILKNLFLKLQTGEISTTEMKETNIEPLGPGPSHKI